MRLLRRLVAALLGYLLGTFPSADLASRVATRGEVDLRDEGSGNPGATNAASVLGTGWGAAVLAADVGKGALAGLVGRGIAGDSGAYLAATASIAGHCWPVWNGFQGGKGVATSGGTCLVVFPAYTPVDATVAVLSVVSTRQAETAMWITAPVWVAASIVWWRRGISNWWGPKPTIGLVGFSAAGCAMVLTKFMSARKSS